MSQIILDSANDLIQGDFDNATLSQRTRLQTSTINATTGVYVVPNGTANAASVQISNAADPTNASKVVLATNGSTDTQIISGANGSGTYLPLSFYTNNDIRFQMGNAGELNVRTAPGTVSSGTSGQFLTSGGPGAGVSWTTAAAGGFSNMQVFASPGTFTTPSTTTKIKVTVVGGGGSGASRGSPSPTGSSATSGGGGGYAQGIYTVAASSPFAVTVGSGGAAVSTILGPGTGVAGNGGGTSSFGALISATGGGGGSASPGAGGGAGGGGVSGAINIPGGPGAGSPAAETRIGGGSVLGATTTQNIAAGNLNGTTGNSYGAGGTSAINNTNAGTSGAGAGGVVIVEW